APDGRIMSGTVTPMAKASNSTAAKSDDGWKNVPRRTMTRTAVVTANTSMTSTNGLLPERGACGANGNSSKATASANTNRTKARGPAVMAGALARNRSGKMAGAKYLDSGGIGKPKTSDATQTVIVKYNNAAVRTVRTRAAGDIDASTCIRLSLRTAIVNSAPAAPRPKGIAERASTFSAAARAAPRESRQKGMRKARQQAAVPRRGRRAQSATTTR